MTSDPLPISLVAHTAFCPRRAWLESVGETVASIAIEQGQADHERVDTREDERVARRRSVNVAHDELGLVGRCDLLDVTDGGVEIVEFKSSPLRRSTEVTRAQVVQLALQRLCLEADGRRVVGQKVYFTTAKASVDVPIGAEELAAARELVAETRRIVGSEFAPPALVDDPRCRRCSHVGICLPDERRPRRVRRRIVVADPDGEVVHVTIPGGRVSMAKGRLRISQMGVEIRSLPLERVQSLTVHGNVDISSGLIRELLWQQRVVVWCSFRGRVVGYAVPAQGPNGQARVQQHVRSARGDMALARELVSSKIANQATQLRRNSRCDLHAEVVRLRTLARLANSAKDRHALLGLEGDAAAIYFRGLPSMLNASAAEICDDWPGRHARGARDPLNVMLNLSYGLLLGDVLRALVACGLDPHAGFLHSSGRNKPALALDLMEQFRPVVADSAVLGALNNGEVGGGMISRVLGDARLRDDGRRSIVAAYERRVTSEFTHPIFGYKLSWRRAMEVQARMVLGVIDGTQDSYLGIRVR